MSPRFNQVSLETKVSALNCKTAWAILQALYDEGVVAKTEMEDVLQPYPLDKDTQRTLNRLQQIGAITRGDDGYGLSSDILEVVVNLRLFENHRLDEICYAIQLLTSGKHRELIRLLKNKRMTFQSIRNAFSSSHVNAPIQKLEDAHILICDQTGAQLNKKGLGYLLFMALSGEVVTPQPAMALAPIAGHSSIEETVTAIKAIAHEVRFFVATTLTEGPATQLELAAELRQKQFYDMEYPPVSGLLKTLREANIVQKQPPRFYTVEPSAKVWVDAARELDAESDKDRCNKLKALADPTRLRLILHLKDVQETSQSSAASAISSKSKSNTVNHLKMLLNAGVVKVCRKVGRSNFYTLAMDIPDAFLPATS